jgi:hypothetical protein
MEGSCEHGNKILGGSLVAAHLAASEEGLSSVSK